MPETWTPPIRHDVRPTHLATLTKEQRDALGLICDGTDYIESCRAGDILALVRKGLVYEGPKGSHLPTPRGREVRERIA